MHAHCVLAHPEPKSFNNHLVTTVETVLKQKGWSYQSAFNIDPLSTSKIDTSNQVSFLRKKQGSIFNTEQQASDLCNHRGFI